MKQAKTLVATLIAVAAWGASTAAAEAASFKAEGSVKGTTTLETELGEKLEAKEAKVSLSITELPGSSGPATIQLAQVTEPRTKTECQTEGASAGTVIVPGEFQVVWSSLSPLEAAVLFSFTEAVAICNSGKLKVKVRQSLLTHLSAPLHEVLLSLGLSAKCAKKGKQEPKEYFNDEGKAIKAQLSANFGLGFETACLRTEKELTLDSASTFEVGTAASGLPSIESATALELPDVHLLSGEEYPVTANGSVPGKEVGEVVGKLETELGEKLIFTGVSILLELLELSSLGPEELVFTGVSEPKAKVSCHTTGEPEGVVVLPSEYHVVDTSTAPLTAALLVLFKELVMECGKLKVKARAPWIIHLNVTAGTDVTGYGLAAKCSGKGKQELREYLNDEGKSTKGQLTMNFGLGFETACAEINQELTVTSSKMVDFLF